MSEPESVSFENNIWLVGLRIDADDEFPTFYTLVTGEFDTLIQTECRIILFDKVALMPMAAKLGGISHLVDEVRSLELEVVYDFASTLYLVENATTDQLADVLNCLNFFVDVVRTTKANMPERYRRQLSDIASHLTFSKSLGDYFNKSEYKRSEIIEGLVWCLDCLFSHSRILH